MQISKALFAVVTAGLVAAAVSTSSPSMADDGAPPPPDVSCKNGDLTVKGKGGWRVNGAAPWSWDKASGPAKFEGCDKDNHCDAAKFKGSACGGTVKVFVCTATTCAPPMKVAVTGG
jgi:hypothetical protein